MSNRLYSDLLGSGGRYYFGLNSAPGGISPAPAVITLVGRDPIVIPDNTVFRTPATAVLTIQGRSVAPDFILSPAAAALGYVGQIPEELRQIIITNALPPDYSDPVSNAPTILFIQTVTPTTGLISIASLEHNVTQGGNIGFLNPGVGSVSIQSLPYSLVFMELGVGGVTVVGQVPALTTTLTLGTDEDGGLEVQAISVIGLTPTLSLPFQWIDVDPPPSTTWTTTTGVAA